MTVGNHTLPSTYVKSCSDGLMSCISQWAGSVTNGLFWVIALLSFCVVLMMALGRYGFKRSFGFAGFVAIIGSVWFAIMGLISWDMATIFILTGIVAIVIMVMDER